MATEVFDFRWSILETGYQWIEAEVSVHAKKGARASFSDAALPGGHPQWVLTESLPSNHQGMSILYSPLKDHAGLFRDFADISADDRNSILAFANSYGLLGVGQFSSNRKGTSKAEGVIKPQVETWRAWKEEIAEMRRAVEIWDMVKARNVTSLARYIHWRGDQCYYESTPGAYPDNVQAGDIWEVISPVPDLFRTGDVLMPAYFLVQRWINTKLEGNTGPQLRYDTEDGKPVLQIFPFDLLSAMWLQFAQAVAGNRDHRQCKECRKWFEVSTIGVVRPKKGPQERFRTNRIFCSDACKSRDHRKRKDDAQRLKSEGKSVAAIAKQLDRPVETIKGWTSKGKG